MAAVAGPVASDSFSSSYLGQGEDSRAPGGLADDPGEGAYFMAKIESIDKMKMDESSSDELSPEDSNTDKSNIADTAAEKTSTNTSGSDGTCADKRDVEKPQKGLPAHGSASPTEADRTMKLEARKLRRKLVVALDALEDSIDDESSNGISARIQENLTDVRGLFQELHKMAALGKRGNDNGIGSEGSRHGGFKAKQVTMELYKKMLLHDDQDSATAIVAFYRILPTATRKSKSEALPTNERGPQRLAIFSSKLSTELEDITKITTRSRPAIMARPFKWVVKFYPQIRARLADLERRLEKKDKMANRVDEISLSSAATTSLALESRTDVLGKQTSSQVDKPRGQERDSGEPGGKVGLDTELAESEGDELYKRTQLLRLLCDFIQSDLSYYIELAERAARGTLEKIAFPDLWFIFQPGETIFVTEKDGDEQLYKIFAVNGGQTRKVATKEPRPYDEWEFPSGGDVSYGQGSWAPFEIDCYHLSSDGYVVGPVEIWKHIKHFSGEVKVTDLPICPLRYRKDKEDILARLTARGRRYLSAYGHKTYTGMPVALRHNPAFRRELVLMGNRSYHFAEAIRAREEKRELVGGDIFIDLTTFCSQMPFGRPRLGELQAREGYQGVRVDRVDRHEMASLVDPEVDEEATSDFKSRDPTATDLVPVKTMLERPDAAEDNHLCLLPWQIPGFVFREKRFEMLDVNLLKDIDRNDWPNKRGLDDLVIPEEHRDLLIATVRDYVGRRERSSTSTNSSDGMLAQIDIIKDKGRGLVILLHGPPGSGKTSTAEALATFTRRPLYHVTCGDLGTDANAVEKSLHRHGTTAHQWDCILLLDEADVFLQRRDYRDTQRNALVSVFLQQLEYYKGIIILTTNRTGVIDEALKSRIHLPLYYPNIGEKETKQIWENTLDRIERNEGEADGLRVWFQRKELVRWAVEHYREHEATGKTWNGRQIRNAFQLAIQLGKQDLERRLAEKGLTAEAVARLDKPQKWMKRVRIVRDHMDTIARAADEFDDYLVRTRGTDREFAIDNYLRNDDVPPESLPLQQQQQLYQQQLQQQGFMVATPAPAASLQPYARKNYGSVPLVGGLAGGMATSSLWPRAGAGVGAGAARTGAPKRDEYDDDSPDDDSDDDGHPDDRGRNN